MNNTKRRFEKLHRGVILILSHRIKSGICDNKVRERLLQEANLSLAKTDEICRAAESTIAQMKIVGGEVEPEVNKVEREREPQKFRKNSRRRQQPSQGRHIRKIRNRVPERNATNVEREIISRRNADRRTWILLNLKKILRNCIKRKTLTLSQLVVCPDTGAQCNVLPLHIYRKATNDKKLRKRTSAADGTSGVWEH